MSAGLVGALSGSTLAGSAGRPDEFMYEAELGDDSRGENKGIKVGLAHAAVERVDRKRKRGPSLNQCLDGPHLVGVEVHTHREGAGAFSLRLQPNTIDTCRAERVDDVKIVRP